MFHYHLTTLPSFQVNTKTIDAIIENISNTLSEIQLGTVNIVFCSEDRIQELNKNYRSLDKVTDVLSFHYHEVFDNLQTEDIAGELIFCENKIIEQGKEYGLGSEKEFYKLLIHSLLHILGYDHETDEQYEIMKKLEEKIWKEVLEK